MSRVPRQRLVAMMGGSGVPPLSSPAGISGLRVWLTAETGLYQTAGGAAAVADTDPVGQWQDQSGNNHHFAQATADKRPLLKLNIVNGKPVVRFDGTNDFLQISSLLPADGTKTFFVVTQKRSAPGATQQQLATFGNVMQVYTDSDLTPGYRYYGADANIGGTPTDWTIITLKFADLNTLTPYINGAVGANINPTDTYNTATSSFLGAGNAAGASPGDFDIPEMVIYDSNLGDVDRGRVETYLATRYGITLA